MKYAIIVIALVILHMMPVLAIATIACTSDEVTVALATVMLTLSCLTLGYLHGADVID